jgi:methylmalonyl-CoA mutase cobalamin-binding domain/chain
MHLGLSTWPATRDALQEIVAALAEDGHHVERFGLCLDRGMSLPEARRDGVRKETGPRLAPGEWREIGEIAPVQPHLGDFMIGTPASLENTLHALRAGVTTIGNVGQYFAFDTPGGDDECATTEATVMALGAMAAMRSHGALVHSYLDDGPAMQFSHYGAYVGWAALELYIVERLLGARLAHGFGGLVPDPATRAMLSFALDDLRERDSVGSMIYGNTVDYTADHVRNGAVLATCLLVDIATQLHRPTGHAIMPVPLTEAQRIPSAQEIVAVQRVAREIEREARRSAALFDWPHLERMGAELAAYGRRFAAQVLALLADDGIDSGDAAALLLALRRADPVELERRVAMAVPIPPEIARLETWKAVQVRVHAARIGADTPRLTGMRLVLAVLEVHDVIRDALAVALPRRGCEVILLPSTATPGQVARAAVEEDAAAVVIGTYNGCALSLARELRAALDEEGFDGAVIFGGRLNEDMGGPLPVDVRQELRGLGVQCVERAEELGPLLETLRGT